MKFGTAPVRLFFALTAVSAADDAFDRLLEYDIPEMNNMQSALCSTQATKVSDCLNQQLTNTQRTDCINCLNRNWPATDDTCADIKPLLCGLSTTCRCLSCADEIDSWLQCQYPWCNVATLCPPDIGAECPEQVKDNMYTCIQTCAYNCLYINN